MMHTSLTILQLDIDPARANARAETLHEHGHVVDRVVDPQLAAERAGDIAYDVALIHRDVPGAGSVAGQLLGRSRRALGIIMLATTWETDERRTTIATIADECLEDRDDARDLLAHLKAFSRRSASMTGRAGSAEWGPVRVDFVGGFAEVDGQEIVLQPLQLRILGYLTQRAGRVVTHEELRRHIFRAALADPSTSIARQVSVLRKQLGSRRDLIMTTPGGYQLGADPERLSTHSPVRLLDAPASPVSFVRFRSPVTKPASLRESGQRQR